MSPRWRLMLAAAAFLGWMGYLGYAAVTKSRAPIVSHIQSAAAKTAVVAEISGPGAEVAVVESLWGAAPQGTIAVVNLESARGYSEPGKYLLLLDNLHEPWALVGPQHSPGDSTLGAQPLIYPWNEDVRLQAERLKPVK